MLLRYTAVVTVLLLVSVVPRAGVPLAAADSVGTFDGKEGTTASVGRVTSGTAEHWAWPLPSPHAVLRPFVAPATRYGAGHRGIDIASAGSTPVTITAPDDGVVHFAGVLFGRGVLSIQHVGGLLTSYEPVTTLLRRGDIVSRGSAIGILDPGHCAGVSLCLHFGVRLDGEYLSPLNFLGGIPRSVLLPPG